MAKRGQGEGSISKRPDGRWWARITLGKDENGKQIRRAFYGESRAEVQAQLTETLNEINQGTYFEPSGVLFEDWIKKWLEEYKKPSIKPSSYDNYVYLMQGYIIPELGQYPLKDLQTHMIQKLIAGMTSKERGYSTIEKTVRLIKGSLNQAIKNDMLKKNVALGVVMPQITERTRRSFSADEQARFIDAAQQDSEGGLFLLILSTGLRLGEATALTWSDIDFEKGQLFVNRTQVTYRDFDNPDDGNIVTTNAPKTKASKRKIPLFPHTVDLLKELRQKQEDEKARTGVRFEQGWIFCDGLGEMYKRGAAWRIFRRIAKDAGVYQDTSPHCLRHTFATRGLESGISPKVMQELLGHAHMKTTSDQYTHVMPDTKHEYIMKISDCIPL